MWLVDLNYSCEYDWLIEMSDNKPSNNYLSNNKLSDNYLASELVKNRSIFKPITIEEIVIFMIIEVNNSVVYLFLVALFCKRNRKPPCFYRVIQTLEKVWETKKLWKHSPSARV